MEIKIVPIDSVKPDPSQPRKIFSQSYITGLAESLKVEGLINPVEVDSDLMIITGECRWRAAKEADWTEIAVNITKNKLSNYERLRRQMAENIHQSAAGGSSPMNAVDVANGYRRLIKMRTGKDSKPGLQSREEIYGLMKDIPQELGISKVTVYEYLRLLGEPKYVIQDILKGTPRTFYREIGFAPKEYQERLKKAVSKGAITKRNDLQRFVRLARISPEKAQIEILRLTHKQNENANRVLNRIVELNLVLSNTNPSRFAARDKQMIADRIDELKVNLNEYLRKL